MKAFIFSILFSVCTCYKPGLKNWIINDLLPKHKNYKEWWNNPIIHTFGNSGFGGLLHSEMAEFATDLIDKKAYYGRNIRKEITDCYCEKLPMVSSVVGVDFGCGVGAGTRSLDESLSNLFTNYQVYGIDTSKHMINKARNIDPSSNVIYKVDNVVKTPLFHLRNKVDIVTVMFLFHEVPVYAQDEIIKSAYALLKDNGILVIVDVCETYNPSFGMLLGEPYILDYQKTFSNTVDNFISHGYFKHEKSDLNRKWIHGHVSVSTLRKNVSV